MPIVFGQETKNVLGQAVIQSAVDVKEREKEIAEFDKTQDSELKRVRGNLQTILNKGGTTEDLNSYLKEVEKTASGVVPQRPRELEPVNVKNTALALTRGSIKGITGFASIPFMATDLLGSLARKVLPGAPAEVEFPISDAIQGIGQSAADLFDPNKISTIFGSVEEKDIERQFVTRAAEKVGEFVTPGAGITLGLTRKGAQLLSKAPETLKWWQKSLVSMAENPTRTQMFEAGLNTGAAVGGETAVTLTVDPNSPTAKEDEGWVRFGGEMSTLLGVGVGFGMLRGAQRLKALAKSRLAVTPGQQEHLAQIHVGTLLNEIEQSDAVNIAARMKAAEDLSKKTGVDFFTPDLFQNPDLQAAFQKVTQTGHLAATKYYAVLAASRQRLNTYIQEISPVLSKGGDDLQTEVKSFLDNKFTELDSRLVRAEQVALDEVQILNPDKTMQDLGESAIEMVKLLEREALDQIDSLYIALDDGIKLPTSAIDSGVQQAKLNPQFLRQNLQRIARGEAVTDLANVGLDPRIQNLVDIAEANFGKKNPKASLGAIVQFRRMVQDEFRIAAIHGDTDVMRRLGRMLAGVDGQLNRAARGNTFSGQQAKALKEANAAYTAMKGRFDKSFEVVGIQKDISGIYTVTPESFARRFIKPDSSPNPVAAAKAFRKVYEGDPQATELLVDAVRLQLSKLEKNGALNATAVGRWLKNHESNLKAHGIWDRFKDIPSTIANMDQTIIDVGMDRKLWERSQLAKFTKTENVTTFIQSKIKAGTIGEFADDVRRASPAAGRALVREVWDDILVKSDSGVLDNSIVNDSGELIRNTIRTPDIMLKTLIDNQDDLTRALGSRHYRALKEIAESVKLQEGTVPTGGTRAIPESSAPVGSKRATQSAFSKIRASMQGFVSPQFTMVQLANQGLDILNSGAAQRVVEEAMYDPEYAIKLMKIARTAGGKEALKTIWIQMTAYAVASESAFTGDDPREKE